MYLGPCRIFSIHRMYCLDSNWGFAQSEIRNMLVSGSTRPLRDSGCLFMVQAFWEVNVVLGSDLRVMSGSLQETLQA